MVMNFEHDLGVVFSLRDGDVWASRFDGRPPMLLGAHDEVVEAMGDFIRQSEFAQRLLAKAANDQGTRPDPAV